MGHHMSESIEMYLLRIALLQQYEAPVPVPKLAQELAVSPVSANEMCRKLTEKALITYEPYKGVQLTPAGEQLARRVLRHRRLWEVFFVEKLGVPPLEAEEIACRFEHVTPETVAERLDGFLEHPTHSPQNEPIPAGAASIPTRPAQALITLAVGQRATIAHLTPDPIAADFLQQQGLQPGMPLKILAAGNDGTLLLAVSDHRLAIACEIAQDILVTVDPQLEPVLEIETV